MCMSFIAVVGLVAALILANINNINDNINDFG